MLQIHHVTGLVPRIPTNGLRLHLDATAVMSYSGGSEWRDLSGHGNHIDFFGNIVRNNRFLSPPAGSNAYGRTRSMLDLRGTKAVTVISVSRIATRSDGTTSGMLYEHTSDWNILTNYDGNVYGGFGFFPNSEGSFYNEGVVHAQLRGNGAIIRNGSPYSGLNYLAPGMPAGVVHTVIHDFNDQTSQHQTSAYVNGVSAQAVVNNAGTALSNNTFDRDHFFLWSRGGNVGFSTDQIAAIMIYNRTLTLAEIQQITQMYRNRFGV